MCKTGREPYLAIDLLTVQKWEEALIGITWPVAGIVAQTPPGTLIEAAPGSSIAETVSRDPRRWLPPSGYVSTGS